MFIPFNSTNRFLIAPIRAIRIFKKYLYSITDLILAVVQLLRIDINGLVKTALGELKPVKLWDKG